MVRLSDFLFFDRPFAEFSVPKIPADRVITFTNMVWDKRPSWMADYLTLIKCWDEQRQGESDLADTLWPLRANCRLMIFGLSNRADHTGLDEAAKIAIKAKMPLKKVADMVNGDHAASELIRHILVGEFEALNADYEALFSYCDRLFKTDFSELLAKGYLLRISALTDGRDKPSPHSLFLNNELIVPLLARFDLSIAGSERDGDKEVIAWHIFRQILAPYLDPASKEKAEIVCQLAINHRREVVRLRDECFSLANEIKKFSPLDFEQKDIAALVAERVKPTIQALMTINSQYTADFINDALSNLIWTELPSVVESATNHSGDFSVPHVAIRAFSAIGLAAYKAFQQKRKDIEKNGFAFIKSLSEKN